MNSSTTSGGRKEHLALWEAGMHVFPLYGAPRDEAGEWRCDCGDPDCQAPFKHPRARNWQNTPLWDKTIRGKVTANWVDGVKVL